MSIGTKEESVAGLSEMEIGGLKLRPRWPVPRVALLGALVLLLCALSSAAVSTLLPPIYGAQVELLMKPPPELSDTGVERAMLTEEVVMTSASVLEPVAAQAGIPLDALHAAVTSSMVGRSNVLRLTVTDRKRERALSLLRGIEREYASVRATTTEVAASSDQPVLTYTTLTRARLLDEPVAPRPLKALAAGTIVGVFAAAVVAVLMLRPVISGRRSPPQ